MVSADGKRSTSDDHRATVDSLARDLGLPFDQVETIYLAEKARIESGARIKTYVTVLTVGRVRNRLHGRGQGGH